MFRGLAYHYYSFRSRRFRVCGCFAFVLGFVRTAVSFMFICALGVGFCRLAVATVLCACLAVPVCHTATSLF